MKLMNRKKRILIVDDDPAIVDAICFILQDEGYEPVGSIDSKAASDLHHDLPDVLLLDIWMSGQDCCEICRQLKQQNSTKMTPIIMISANRDCAAMAREAGADDFLAKPFEMDELLAKVAKYA